MRIVKRNYTLVLLLAVLFSACGSPVLPLVGFEIKGGQGVPAGAELQEEVVLFGMDDKGAVTILGLEEFAVTVKDDGQIFSNDKLIGHFDADGVLYAAAGDTLATIDDEGLITITKSDVILYWSETGELMTADAQKIGLHMEPYKAEARKVASVVLMISVTEVNKMKDPEPGY